MENIMIFEGHNVEIFEFNGKVLFNPHDVGECLNIKDIKSTIRNFNDNQKVKITNNMIKNSDVHTMHFRKLNNAGEVFLTEAGVYKLVFKSRKKEAEKFSNWVTDEVLPIIRKTGAYMTPETMVKVMQDPDFLIGILNEVKSMQNEISRLNNEKQELIEIHSREKESLIDAVHELEEESKEMQPKVKYYDIILRSKEALCITQIAKDYGFSGSKMNKLLGQLGIQYKLNGQWLLYKKYDSEGYTVSNTVVIREDENITRTYTKWSQKGRLFIYNKLKELGILPLCEQKNKKECSEENELQQTSLLN